MRGADGAVNVLVNRCAHRSVQFCTANRGTAKEFVCPYHQWTYDLGGQSARRAVPPRLSRPGRHAGRFPPGGARAAAARGDLPPRRRVRQLRRAEPNRWKPISATTCSAISTACSTAANWSCWAIMRQRIPSNWKLMFENIKDPYHASLLHVFLVTFGLFRLDQQSAVEMDDTGGTRCWSAAGASRRTTRRPAQMRAFKANFALRDPRLLEPVREFAGDATVVMQTLWPNLIVQQQSNTLAMRQIVPIDAGTFRSRLDLLRLCRRHAGDAAAPAAPGQSDGARRARLARRQRGDAAVAGRDRGQRRRPNASPRWAAAPFMTSRTW